MTLSAPMLVEPRQFRWSRDEYYHLAEQGTFDGRRVELIDGEIIEMPPQKDAHSWSIGNVDDLLRPIAGLGHWVRTQLPLELSAWSDPEPDVAIVVGSRVSWKAKGQPTGAVLVIEISDATLAFDRRVKLAIYAASGIAEYWIVNLVDQQLEVFRDPLPDAANPRASRYGSKSILRPGEFVTPLAFAHASIAVADLLA